MKKNSQKKVYKRPLKYAARDIADLIDGPVCDCICRTIEILMSCSNDQVLEEIRKELDLLLKEEHSYEFDWMV